MNIMHIKETQNDRSGDEYFIHVDSNDFAFRSNFCRRQEHVEASSASQVDDDLSEIEKQ
jgi:hypothetical protein